MVGRTSVALACLALAGHVLATSGLRRGRGDESSPDAEPQPAAGLTPADMVQEKARQAEDEATARKATFGESGKAEAAKKPCPAPGRTGEALFVAGLEGSLHHFWFDVVSPCVWGTHNCSVPIDSLKWALWAGMDHPDYLSDFWCMQRWEDPSSLLYLNFEPSMLSYPNYYSPKSPDLPNIAAAARKNNDTLKVLVMTRDADDLLASALRGFRGPDHLIAAGKLMLQHLQQIPAENIKCLDVDDIPEITEELSGLFVDPQTHKDYLNGAKAVKRAFNADAIKHCEEESCRNEEVRDIVRQLRGLCSRLGATAAGADRESKKRHAKSVRHFVFGA